MTRCDWCESQSGVKTALSCEGNVGLVNLCQVCQTCLEQTKKTRRYSDEDTLVSLAYGKPGTVTSAFTMIRWLVPRLMD